MTLVDEQESFKVIHISWQYQSHRNSHCLVPIIQGCKQETNKSCYIFRVDALYAFFVQWSPNIYGGDDIDPLSRGFIMVDEEEGEEQPKKTMDIIDDYYKPEMKRLTRQMTKDWEVRISDRMII